MDIGRINCYLVGLVPNIFGHALGISYWTRYYPDRFSSRSRFPNQGLCPCFVMVGILIMIAVAQSLLDHRCNNPMKGLIGIPGLSWSKSNNDVIGRIGPNPPLLGTKRIP